MGIRLWNFSPLGQDFPNRWEQCFRQEIITFEFRMDVIREKPFARNTAGFGLGEQSFRIHQFRSGDPPACRLGLLFHRLANDFIEFRVRPERERVPIPRQREFLAEAGGLLQGLVAPAEMEVELGKMIINCGGSKKMAQRGGVLARGPPGRRPRIQLPIAPGPATEDPGDEASQEGGNL